MTFSWLFVILQIMKPPEQQKEVHLFVERATHMLAVAEHNLAGEFYESLVETGRLVMSKIASPSQSLTNQEEIAVQQFIFELKKQFKNAVYAITLYGSKARGDAFIDSDIDLLIVMDSDAWVIRNQVSHIASRISLEFDLLLSPHVISKETWQEMMEAPLSFYKNILQEGIPLLHSQV